ncbi:MAG TPA: general secretion pathway protein GspD [Rhodocyclaceae bacterium]|nr:general secretion pathway protein GspD [Rhodocyclaceae bacterium]HND23018.1 general secretion pathway protein GspD [Rhodocyclaceae bacterium]HNF63312.1 general secretion pathway protein GspD [Rhodocyclaceae bacterium]
MTSRRLPRLLRRLAPLALTVLLAACAGNKALEESRRSFATQSPDVALIDLRSRVEADPRNLELRAYYLRQREALTTRQLAMADQARGAGRFEEAENALALARQFDPNNPRVVAGVDAIAAQRQRNQLAAEADRRLAAGDFAGAEAAARTVLAGEPTHAAARAVMRRLDERAVARDPAPAALKGPLAKPVNLEFRDAPLRGVFEVLSRVSGLNFVMDRDVRTDAKVTIFVRNNSIDDVLKLLMITQQLERKLLNDNSVLIYPNTPAKQRDYQELATRSFYLANADTKQAMNLIKQVVKTKDVFIEEKLNLLVMKDTPEAIRLAERLIATLDLAEPEVMLEVEVMEISRNKLLELGMRFPNQIGYGVLQPTVTNSVTTATGTTITQSLGGQLLQGNIDLRGGRSGVVPYVANPGLLLNLTDQDGNANILANPRIRVKNRDKAKIHIGEKLPIFTTTATANVGVSASVNYLDVGLKLEVEPSVHMDDDVAIKVNLEVSSVVKEVTGPSNSIAYQVGTRSASTSLRLKDGETQVLAGLISDEERSSAARLPGLGEVPALGRLFSSQRDVENKTEIILLITPRVVRNVTKPGLASATQAAGTEAAVGVSALSIGPTAPGALGVAAAAPGAMPAASPATGALAAATSVQAPPEVKAGEEFTVSVGVQAGGNEGGSVDLNFDSRLVESADGPADGDLRKLTLPPGTAGVVFARFRVRPGASGTAVFALGQAQLRVGGQAQMVPPPPPVSVQIQP